MNKNAENDRRDAEFRGTINFFYQQELGRDAEPEGMDSFLNLVRLPPDGLGWTGEQVQKLIHDSPEAQAYRSRPKPPPLPSLAIDGMQFANPQRLCGTNQFRALRMLIDGGDVALDPLIQESKELGFNMWRVFGMGSIAQNQMLQLSPTEPDYYDRLHELAVLLNGVGIVMLYTAYADNQDIKMGDGHWTNAAAALDGTLTLMSGGNEWSKNGWAPSHLTPVNLPWSRGSDVGDVKTPPNGASFMEFHPVRTWPTAMRDAVASPINIYDESHYPRIPLIIDEPPRMGADGSGAVYADPNVCWRFARHYSTECAGAVFHNRAGQRGVPMDGLTRDCAAAWVSGMRI